MSNSPDLNAPYRPHQSVRDHVVNQRNDGRMRFMESLSVADAIVFIRGWRQDFFGSLYLSYYGAIEWDLKTNYGVSDEQLLLRSEAAL